MERPEITLWIQYRRWIGLTCLIIGSATIYRLSLLTYEIQKGYTFPFLGETSPQIVTVTAAIAAICWVVQMGLMVADIRKFPFGFVSTAALIAYTYTLRQLPRDILRGPFIHIWVGDIPIDAIVIAVCFVVPILDATYISTHVRKVEAWIEQQASMLKSRYIDPLPEGMKLIIYLLPFAGLGALIIYAFILLGK